MYNSAEKHLTECLSDKSWGLYRCLTIIIVSKSVMVSEVAGRHMHMDTSNTRALWSKVKEIHAQELIDAKLNHTWATPPSPYAIGQTSNC